MSTPARVLFVDRDGTLIREPEDYQVDALDKVELLPDVIPSLLALRDYGYRFVMVTNQDGLGSDAFPQAEFDGPHAHVLRLFGSQGIDFEEVLICPHLPDAGCDCRKPKTGLLTRFLAHRHIDLDASAVVGDRDTDLELAERLGIRGFLIDPDGPFESTWPGIASALRPGARRATYERVTKETTIAARINLDAEEPVVIDTGIGFFDHMLEQIAKHAGLSLELSCSGDLDVDAHHTVEDTAIALGEVLRQALGSKRGIGRFGFLLPMDETEARVSLDLSGRPFSKFEGRIDAREVGGLPTEMVPHFFRSFSDAARAAVHITVTGENSHHMVEACFKGLGRALRQAIRQDGDSLPSTKGVL